MLADMEQKINQVIRVERKLGRLELLTWVNDFLRTDFTKIQDCADGVAYCQLLDAVFPGKVPLQKLNFHARFVEDNIRNLRVLEDSLIKLGIKKEFDIQAIAKGKFQENHEFLQWLHAFLQRNPHMPPNLYKAFERRWAAQDKQKKTGGLAARGRPVGLNQNLIPNEFGLAMLDEPRAGSWVRCAEDDKAVLRQMASNAQEDTKSENSADNNRRGKADEDAEESSRGGVLQVPNTERNEGPGAVLSPASDLQFQLTECEDRLSENSDGQILSDVSETVFHAGGLSGELSLQSEFDEQLEQCLFADLDGDGDITLADYRKAISSGLEWKSSPAGVGRRSGHLGVDNEPPRTASQDLCNPEGSGPPIPEGSTLSIQAWTEEQQQDELLLPAHNQDQLSSPITEGSSVPASEGELLRPGHVEGILGGSPATKSTTSMDSAIQSSNAPQCKGLSMPSVSSSRAIQRASEGNAIPSSVEGKSLPVGLGEAIHLFGSEGMNSRQMKKEPTATAGSISRSLPVSQARAQPKFTDDDASEKRPAPQGNEGGTTDPADAEEKVEVQQAAVQQLPVAAEGLEERPVQKAEGGQFTTVGPGQELGLELGLDLDLDLELEPDPDSNSTLEGKRTKINWLSEGELGTDGSLGGESGDHTIMGTEKEVTAQRSTENENAFLGRLGDASSSVEGRKEGEGAQEDHPSLRTSQERPSNESREPILSPKDEQLLSQIPSQPIKRTHGCGVNSRRSSRSLSGSPPRGRDMIVGRNRGSGEHKQYTSRDEAQGKDFKGEKGGREESEAEYLPRSAPRTTARHNRSRTEYASPLESGRSQRASDDGSGSQQEALESLTMYLESELLSRMQAYQDLLAEVDAVNQERRFYHKKLQKVEQVCEAAKSLHDTLPIVQEALFILTDTSDQPIY